MGNKQEKPTEYKTFPFKLTDLEGRTLEGYASVFNNTDSVGDVVHAGAFRKTLEQRGEKIKFLWQHDPTEPIGRPIELREDDQGLFVKAIISDTQRGRDALALLSDGAIGELSIGYDAIKGGTDYSKDDEGNEIRNLKELRLYEFSLVTFAANEKAQVTALKEDPAPSESKPAPETTENTIRIRVHDPGDFEDDSFRTITIGPKNQGIQAVIGRLEGEDSTTVQAYIFDKDKFNVEEAQAWVDEHKKDGVPDDWEQKVVAEEALEDEEPGDAEQSDEEPEKAADPDPETKEPPEAVVFASVVLQDTLAKLEPDSWEYKAAELALSKLRGLYGEDVDVVELEEKAGRVLAARNAQRIGNALGALISVLEDAGIDIPGFGKKPEPEEEDEDEGKDWSLEIETAAAELDLFELEH